MNIFFAALVGALTGMLSGFGIGGGTLLILWLTLVSDMDQRAAGGVNLLYFICCALPALWSHIKNGLVEKKTVRVAVLWGVPSCILGALLAAFLDVTLLRRIFGVFLLFVGFREVFLHKQPSGGAQ